MYFLASVISMQYYKGKPNQFSFEKVRQVKWVEHKRILS